MHYMLFQMNLHVIESLKWLNLGVWMVHVLLKVKELSNESLLLHLFFGGDVEKVTKTVSGSPDDVNTHVNDEDIACSATPTGV